MMNEYNEKTVVRTRRMPFRPSPNSDTEHGLNVLPVGTHLGEFEILDLIGEGGFGIVYLAYDHSLERHVALKEYMPSGLATRTTKMAVTVRSQHNAATFTAGLKSFINEARMLAQFDSPSLVKVHRFWEGNGTAYMVMPFYEGVTLKQAYKEHRITPTEAWIRVLLADLFDAIETIHNAHCLHRDIAPDNILLLKDGRPLLLDFGAARRVIGDLTQCLTVILKPGFAPIEQYADIAGLRQGAWTDIYALAALVYYLITGKAPPPAVARMVHDELVPAREVGKGRYSNAFLAVLDKALSVKPEQRYKSIAEVRRALDIMEAVPRTLPRSDSDWATTIARTAPLAEEKLSAAPESRPKAAPHAEPAPESATQWAPPYSGWQQPQERDKRLEARLRQGKPAWLVLGVLLSAGIAAGVYLGTNRSWDGSAERTAQSGPSIATPDPEPPAQSSGAGGVNEENPIDDKVAAAAPEPTPTPTPTPAAPAITEQPRARAPVAAAPVKPPPPSPPASTATPPRADEATAPKPGRVAAAPGADLPPEDELWRLASKSDKSSAYENYLRKYPKGAYAAVAKLRLESKQPKILMAPPPTAKSGTASGAAASGGDPSGGDPSGANTPDTGSSGASTSGSAASGSDAPAATEVDPSRDEKELWRAATGINEAPAYEAYLNLYPNGRYAATARDKLARAKPAEPAALPAPAAAEQPQATDAAATKPEAPATVDKQASIKPPEPVVPSVQETPKQAPQAPQKQAPETTLKPVPEPPVASGNKSLKLDDQTMIGNFSADPKTGIVSGTGKIIWKNGNQFEGTLVRGIKEGKGKFTWSNGQRYNGDWARDMPNGKGTIAFANGNRYEGEVKDGVPHGRGVNRFKDGDVYSGTWVAGKSHGQGRYTWANGSYWEGEFRNDKRTENGNMVFADNAAGATASGASAPPEAKDQAQDKERAAAAKAPLEK